MNNHIFLVLRFIDELKDISMMQHLITRARETAPYNQEVQTLLDNRWSALVIRKIQIMDTMFEISRSN